MKIYTETLTCDVCGGKGVATMKAASSLWMGGFVSHADPRECAYNLKLKKTITDETKTNI